MQIFAEINLKCGSYTPVGQGSTGSNGFSNQDPTAIAETWEAIGVDWIHVVNLDGEISFEATSLRNIDALQSILDRVHIPVQFGGGLRSIDTIQRILNMGVNRVVIGSMAADRPRQMLDIIGKFGAEQIALGLDVKHGKVANEGWRKMAGTNALDMVEAIQTAGLRHIIYNDLARDGISTGVNLEASLALANAGKDPEKGSYRFSVIVSGGVASLDDVRQVKAFENKGIEGLIMGPAFHTGAIDLADAIEIAHRN